MSRKVRLNIGGPKGNAYYILGLVKQLEQDEEKADKLIRKMTSQDYNNLLRTFTEAFPIVELYAVHDLGDTVDEDLYVVDMDVIEL